MIHHFFSRQFILFLATGGIAALVNFFSRIIFNISWGFSTSVALAYVTGMCTAFILAKVFVFKQSTLAIHQSAVIFALVNVIGFAQTWSISMYMDDYILPELGVTRFASEIAHVSGILLSAFSSYLGHKYLSFK